MPLKNAATLAVVSLALATSSGVARARPQCPLVETATLGGQPGILRGIDVAISGDVLAVGSSNSSSDVHVYERGVGGWALVKTLQPAAGFNYGFAVAVDGATLAIGDFGANKTYIHERDLGGPGSWGERTVLVPSNVAAGDEFGRWIDLAGDLFVGGGDDQTFAGQLSGQAWVFERDLGGPDAWGQAANLKPSDRGQLIAFGSAVAADGAEALVGAQDWENAADEEVGAAYLYRRDQGGPGSWGEVQRLEASDPDEDDLFGAAVAISGDTLAIGAWGDDEGGYQAGAVYLFERGSGGLFAETHKRLAADTYDDIRFGYALDLDGDVLVVGAYGADPFGVDSGAAYVFERNAGGLGAWGQTAKLEASNGAWGDYFGYSVAVDDDAIAAGAFRKNNLEGAAYVFEGAGGAPSSYCTAGTTASGCTATISAAGFLSAGQGAGFDVTVVGSEGQKDGLIYFGTAGAQAAPWGNGSSYQCVVPPVRRTGVQQGTGAPGSCGGGFALDLAAWASANPSKAPAAGDEVYLQCWFRDPASTSNQSTSLSNALSLTVCP